MTRVRSWLVVFGAVIASAGVAGATTSSAPPRAVLRITAGLPQSGVTLGRSSAAVTITLFGDLECSVCKEFMLSRAFAELLDKDVRAGRVRIVYRGLQTATPTAAEFTTQSVAALAAGRQDRFWQFATLFLYHQGPEGSSYVDEAFLQRIARQVPGLRFATWMRERGDPALKRQVRADGRYAAHHRIDATPTLIFTGPRGRSPHVLGAEPYRQLEREIAAVS